jgi:hypothetical protein
MKTHAISDMPRKTEILQILPNFFFFLKKKKKPLQYGNNIICKARSNLRKLDDANIEKQSLDLLFLSSPTSTCKVLSREIGGKPQLVPRLHKI